MYKDEITLKLMNLSPDTIKAIIMDLSELEQTWSVETAIQKLTDQLVALVGEDEAEEMIGEGAR